MTIHTIHEFILYAIMSAICFTVFMFSLSLLNCHYFRKACNCKDCNEYGNINIINSFRFYIVSKGQAADYGVIGMALSVGWLIFMSIHIGLVFVMTSFAICAAFYNVIIGTVIWIGISRALETEDVKTILAMRKSAETVLKPACVQFARSCVYIGCGYIVLELIWVHEEFATVIGATMNNAWSILETMMLLNSAKGLDLSKKTFYSSVKKRNYPNEGKKTDG